MGSPLGIAPNSNQVVVGRMEGYSMETEFLKKFITQLEKKAGTTKKEIFDDGQFVDGAVVPAQESNHPTCGVVDENEYSLFPQLDLPGDLSNSFFEDFVNIDDHMVDNDNEKYEAESEALLMPDLLDFFGLDNQEIDDEASIASKMLSEEDNEMSELIISSLDDALTSSGQNQCVNKLFDAHNVNSIVSISNTVVSSTYNVIHNNQTLDLVEKGTLSENSLSEEESEAIDFITSYLGNDSAASSPQNVDQEVLDILLSNLSSDVRHSVEYGVEEKPSASITDLESCNQMTNMIPENNENTVDEQVLNTSDSNTNGTEVHSEINPEVVDEFLQLLNSLVSPTDTFISPVEESDVIEESIICTVPSTPSLCNNSEELIHTENISDSHTLIQNSVDILMSNDSNVSVNNVDTSNKLKRKHSDGLSIESNVLSPTSLDGGDKVTFRRHKNNEASKVTRAKRRCREKELYEKEQELLKSNAELRIKTEVMQKEADLLRQLLVTALSSAKT